MPEELLQENQAANPRIQENRAANILGPRLIHTIERVLKGKQVPLEFNISYSLMPLKVGQKVDLVERADRARVLGKVTVIGEVRQGETKSHYVTVRVDLTLTPRDLLARYHPYDFSVISRESQVKSDNTSLEIELSKAQNPLVCILESTGGVECNRFKIPVSEKGPSNGDAFYLELKNQRSSSPLLAILTYDFRALIGNRRGPAVTLEYYDYARARPKSFSPEELARFASQSPDWLGKINSILRDPLQKVRFGEE